MYKKIIKTEFEDMYGFIIDLFKCPICGQHGLINKWITEHFVRYTCPDCNTYIFVTSKKFLDLEN